MSASAEHNTSVPVTSPTPPHDEHSAGSPRNQPGTSPNLTEATQDPARLPSDEGQQQGAVTQHETPQRPPFQPFFTLISDSAISTTHHPQQVHYIFDDDDTELLTAACLEAVDAEDAYEASTRPPFEQTPTNNSPPVGARVPENRILLLNVDASGTKVVKAHSLTPNWQILSTSLSPAPTWDTPAQEGGAEEHNMMLRIEGTQALEDAKIAGKVKGSRVQDSGAAVSEEELLALMQEFDQRMKMLRVVVESGEQGRTEGDEHAEQEVQAQT